MKLMSPAEIWAMIEPVIGKWVPVLVGAAAIAMLPFVWRQLRNAERAARFGRAVVTPLVLAWEAQGLHELAMATGVEGPVAWVFACLTSGLLLTLAAWADLHYNEHDNLGWPGRLVWGVAGVMGVAVAFTADNMAEAIARLILPTLALIVWWIPYAPKIVKDDDPSSPKRRAGSWRWTPRRIGVALGLVDPTDADLIDVHAERQIRRLTTASHKLHHGWRIFRGMRANRLRRLGLLATPAMVQEVARRVALVHRIEVLTDPERQADPQPTSRRASVTVSQLNGSPAPAPARPAATPPARPVSVPPQMEGESELDVASAKARAIQLWINQAKQGRQLKPKELLDEVDQGGGERWAQKVVKEAKEILARELGEPVGEAEAQTAPLPVQAPAPTFAEV